MTRSRKEPARCADALRWLAANDHDLAPLTGQDRRALDAFAHLIELYTVADVEGQRAALDAMTATVRAMQEHTRPLCRELIAWAMNWDDRGPVWARITGAPVPKSQLVLDENDDYPVSP